MKCDHCGVKRFVCLMYNCLHTRLRHRSSNLNVDLFRVNLTNDLGCVCGWVIEDAIHFFLECCLYVEAPNCSKV
jgi:hypothetical protein